MNIRVRLLSLFLTISALSGCGMAGLPFTGQVTDAETGEPIEGVTVIAFWLGGTFNDSSSCYRVETATSDKDGKYQVPGWFDGKFHIFGGSYIATYAYKRGYERVSANNLYYKDEIDMALFRGNKEERLKELEAMVHHECFSAKYKQLIPYTKSIYGEALSLATTSSDAKHVKSIKYYLDVLEIGWDKAQKIYNEDR